MVSNGTSTYDGVFVAAEYEVQTLLDPVMTISFGACEVYAGPSGVGLWDTLFSQAASEGISVFVSSADSGAAACDRQFDTPPAYQLRSINYICASSYATCVGGTELVEGANPSQYWSSANSANLESALGYIPEGAWNEPSADGGPPVVAATGGGASIYVPKPLWQAGIGVPTDNARDVPDVSFPAAGHDAYFTCYAQIGGDCANKRFAYFYGTSAAAPAMAAVAALLNQRMGAAQGNFNPLLYRIAASTPAAFHDATPVSSGIGAFCLIDLPSVCNNSVPDPFMLGAGLEGYALTTGYDQATGLGSLDIANFLTAAAANSKSALAGTALMLSQSAATITDLQTATFTAALTAKTPGTPTGTVQFFADGNTLGAPVALAGGVAVTPALPFPAAGSYYISATYSGDASYAAVTAPGLSLWVTGKTTLVTTSVASGIVSVGVPTAFNATLSASTGSAVPTGIVRFPLVGSYTVSAFYLGDTIYSPATSSTSVAVQPLPTQTELSVTAGGIGVGGYKNFGIIVGDLLGSSNPAVSGNVHLLANGAPLGTAVVVTESFNVIFQLETIATPGTYAITGVYSGDAYRQPSTSTPFSLVVAATPAAYQLTVDTPTLTLSAGAVTANTDVLSIVPSNGFAGSFNLTCAVTSSASGSAGSMPTCSLDNSTLAVTVDNGTPATLVTINTIHSLAVTAEGRHAGISGRLGFGGIALCAMLACLTPRRRLWSALATCILLCAGSAAISGCSGKGNAIAPGPTPISNTPAGNYTVPLTATPTGVGSNASVSAISIALTVK